MLVVPLFVNPALDLLLFFYIPGIGIQLHFLLGFLHLALPGLLSLEVRITNLPSQQPYLQYLECHRLK